MFGFSGYSLPPEVSAIAQGSQEESRPREDPHLQSTQELTGYEIEALDGAIGHVSDFMVDEKTWAVPFMAVQTGHWYAGKAPLISTVRITSIDCSASRIFVKLTKADIQRTGVHHIVRTEGPVPRFCLAPGLPRRGEVGAKFLLTSHETPLWQHEGLWLIRKLHAPDASRLRPLTKTL